MTQYIAYPRMRTEESENKRTKRQIGRYIALSLFVLLICLVETRFPNQISRPMAHWVNEVSGKNVVFDKVNQAFALYYTFSGVLLCGILFSLSLASTSEEVKAKILVGVCASFGAGIISRFMQHHLSTHIRPYYDSVLAFKPPPGMTVTPLNTWDSFPSDHACVFAGLVVVLFVVRANVRYYVAVWIALVESSRIYIGAHFPSDLVGGAALASAFVWLFQYPVFTRAGERLCQLEYRAPVLFFTLYFMLFFQVSTLFVEVRCLIGGFNAFETTE